MIASPRHWESPEGDQGVVYVDVQHEGYALRMAGYDHYWTTETACGAWNDPEPVEEFGSHISFLVYPGGFRRSNPNRRKPDNARAMSGIQLPDEEFAQIMREPVAMFR